MTMFKLKRQTFWPKQSTDVEIYIQGCLHCAACRADVSELDAKKKKEAYSSL